MSSPPAGRHGRPDSMLVTEEILGRVCDEMRARCPEHRWSLPDEPVLAQYLELRLGEMFLSLKVNEIPERTIRSWAKTLHDALYVTAASFRAGYLELLSDFMPAEPGESEVSEIDDTFNPEDSPF